METLFRNYLEIMETLFRNVILAEVWCAKRACGAQWVSKSTHPRKFGNHVTVHRPPETWNLKLVYFDSWSGQSFVSTRDVFSCLFPLNVESEIQLLLFMASLFIGFLTEKYFAFAKSEIRSRMASFSFSTLLDS